MSLTILVLFRACKAFLHSTYCSCKNGRSAGKFRKAQIRKFADLKNLLCSRTFRKCGDLWFTICRPIIFVICRFVICGPSFICGLQTSANPKKHNFSPCKYRLKILWFKIFTRWKMAVKKPNFVKEVLRCTICGLAIGGLKQQRNMRICGFAICGQAHLRYLQICNCGMSQQFADLKFADFKIKLDAHLCRFVK